MGVTVVRVRVKVQGMVRGGDDYIIPHSDSDSTRLKLSAHLMTGEILISHLLSPPPSGFVTISRRDETK